MRTRAPTRAWGSTIAVGWIAGSVMALRVGFVELRHEPLQLLLERAHALEQLGQPRLGDHDPLGLPDRPRRRAQHLLAGRQTGRDPGLGAGDDTVPDGDMVGHPDLTGEDHAAPQPR